jgi:hypothetical protein
LRGEPWLRFYTSIYEPDDKTQRLSDRLFRYWVLILCAFKRGGEVMPSVADLAWGLRVPPAKAQSILNDLVKAELLDVTDDGLRPHNWDYRQCRSDVSAERQRRWRDRHKEPSYNVTRDVTSDVTRNKKAASRDVTRNVTSDVTVTAQDYREQNSSLKLAGMVETFGRASSQQPAENTPEQAQRIQARIALEAYPQAFRTQFEPLDDGTIDRVLESFDGNAAALSVWLAGVVKRRRHQGAGENWGLLVSMARDRARATGKGGPQ